MKKTIRKLWNGITTILVAIVVTLAVLLAGVRLLGMQVFTVLSGSMEPAYPVGSLIYVKDVDYRELEAGDVITFMLTENTVATHRIVEVIPDEEDSELVRYRTKGDANNAEDGGLVSCQSILGTPVCTIPYLGYLANYIQHPPGLYLTIAVGALLILMVFLPDLLGSGKKTEASPKGGKYLR